MNSGAASALRRVVKGLELLAISFRCHIAVGCVLMAPGSKRLPKLQAEALPGPLVERGSGGKRQRMRSLLVVRGVRGTDFTSALMLRLPLSTRALAAAASPVPILSAQSTQGSWRTG